MPHKTTFGDFLKDIIVNSSTGVLLDLSKTLRSSSGLNSQALEAALASMMALEKGEIANPTEKRMVGHYWLRNPDIAPSKEIASSITSCLADIKSFAAKIHSGSIKPEKGEKFKYLLLVGIGGSALGPQFVTNALSEPTDKLSIYFFDNTDPDGMERTIRKIPSLKETLTVVISKSGGTKETRNGMLVAKHFYEQNRLDFSKHAVAITCEGSELDKFASTWIKRFPMWDWVGGRTSELSAVGLVPAALQGFDVDAMIKGAHDMDCATRDPNISKNLALQLAATWYDLGKGKGERAMVVLPYSDRLELFSKYLQQLVMESIGKKHNIKGEVVHQGISVYGNKGATDQHAYVQQLRDGLNNFFAVFIRVLNQPLQSSSAKLEVEKGIRSSDFLDGFWMGTRTALFEAERPSITITINEVSPYSIGGLIALFERAVGYYATLIGINAYDQPGVEAGKKAATDALALRASILSTLSSEGESTVDEICKKLSSSSDLVFSILDKLAISGEITRNGDRTSVETKYTIK